MSSQRYWRPIVSQLAADHQVIQLDLLGFGRSPKPKTDYSLEQQVKSVHQTLSAVVADQPVVLVGHSMGALVAAQFAARYPDMIERLVLFNMPLLAGQEEARAAFRSTSFAYRQLLYGQFRHLLWPVIKLTLRAYQRLQRRKHLAMTTRHTCHSRDSSLRLIETTCGIDLLKQLTRPTTLIMGRYDRIQYAKNLERATLSACVQVQTVETGHHTVIDQPAQALQIILGKY